jgi:hypothetical protein
MLHTGVTGAGEGRRGSRGRSSTQHTHTHTHTTTCNTLQHPQVLYPDSRANLQTTVKDNGWACMCPKKLNGVFYN